MAEGKQPVKVVTGGPDWLPVTLELYNDAFAKDPVLTYFINNITNLEKRRINLERLLLALVRAGAINNAIFFYGQQGDYGDDAGKTAPAGCRGVLMKNPKSLDSTSTLIKSSLTSPSLKLGHATGAVPLLRKMLMQFQRQTDGAKKLALTKGEKFYYMYWLATDEKERGKGLASGVVREMQRMARKDNVPLWTEGSTPRSARLYASLGFETIQTFRVGKGECDENGLPKKGGEGAPVEAMVWRQGSKGWADMEA